MTSEEMCLRIAAEAEKHGLSAQRVLLVYKNRVKTISKTRLRINGFDCRLHYLVSMRADEDRHYAMLGVTRSSVRKSDFTILLFRLCDGAERFLVIPSAVLLRQIKKGARFHRFYVPHHKPAPRRSWKKPAIAWELYQDNWNKLVPSRQERGNVSASG